jgi:hypothetical protein
MGEHFICEARRYGDRLYCGRCDLVSAPNAELVCKTPKECGLTLDVLRDAIDDEAERVDGSNIAAAAYADKLIADGQQVVPGPYRDRLRRAAALRAVVRLIDAARADEVIKERLKRGRG